MTLHTVAARPGALVISLDLELQWGIRDREGGGRDYLSRLRGGRRAVPRILELFEEFGIAATWAVVGFLFAESREELERFSPSLQPSYRNGRLSPYGDPLGEDEADDPLHYAPSLVYLIRNTAKQEIGSHTFSHYYCLEEGQDQGAFRADLQSAQAIAALRGLRLRSIVFPRNQHNPSYDNVLVEEGFRAYRGNPPSSAWNFSTGNESRLYRKRAGRLFDSYFGRAKKGPVEWSEIIRPSGLSDVRASLPLRPCRPAYRHLDRLRLARMRRSLRFAARAGRILHLWWHPHNFGAHSELNLEFLREILGEYARCRRRYGMRSLSMAEVDAHATAALPQSSTSDLPISSSVSGSGA